MWHDCCGLAALWQRQAPGERAVAGSASCTQVVQPHLHLHRGCKGKNLSSFIAGRQCSRSQPSNYADILHGDKLKQLPKAASPCTYADRQRVHAGASSTCSAALTGRQMAHIKVCSSPLICADRQPGTAHPKAHTMCKHSTHKHSLGCCVPSAVTLPLQLSDESLAVRHVCSSQHQQDNTRKHTVMSTQRTTCASHLATRTTGSPPLYAQAA